MKEIYLDNAATTKVDEKVVKDMLPYFTEYYGNASSQHLKGNVARKALEDSRRIIASSINARLDEIIFTSGGTESNNLAIKGLFFYHKENKTGKKHIITTKIEHDCVLNTCKWLEKHGAEVTYLDVNSDGFIDLNKLKKSIKGDTLIVSIIHGNNEIGTIQDLEAIGKICKEKGVYFHTDACQSYTKTLINVKKQNLDFVTLNSHKIHGPKGAGALYIKEGIKIIPMAHGGGHERSLRSGTENIPGIVGFASAVKNFNPENIKKMERLRNYLINELLKIPNVSLNGSRENRLCNNVNVSFNDIEGESIGGLLQAYGIYTSTGSACMSHSLETSHVLKALGLSALQSNSSLRISISKYTTEEEIKFFLEIIPKVVERLRKISPLSKIN
ncbi:MAG: cysteine desulfurase family protein [Nanoarchaeota archaeon]